MSSLYGVVRPGERIAPYRLGGGVSLPGLGGIASHWSGHLDRITAWVHARETAAAAEHISLGPPPAHIVLNRGVV